MADPPTWTSWTSNRTRPSEIRGEFKPVATSVPGISITEHLPRLARLADQYAILRSVTHRDNDHAIGAYLALTGYSHPKNAILGIEPPATPLDMPSLGSVVSKLRPADKPVFPYVTLGDLRHFGNNDSMGQNAGCLGQIHDPFTVPFVRPMNGTLDIRGVTSVLETVAGRSLAGRRQLLEQMNRAVPALEATASMRNLDGFTQKAYELLASPASRDAFDLAREPEKVRDCYGPAPLCPKLPAGATSGRSRSSSGHPLLVWQSGLGHPREQFPEPERHVASSHRPGVWPPF